MNKLKTMNQIILIKIILAFLNKENHLQDILIPTMIHLQKLLKISHLFINKFLNMMKK